MKYLVLLTLLISGCHATSNPKPDDHLNERSMHYHRQ